MDTLPLSLHLKAAANAAGAIDWCPSSSSEKWYVETIDYLPCASLTADGTNYCTIRPYAGTGTSTPLAAARATSSTGFTAHTVEAVTITGTKTVREITQANPLHLDVTHAGSGVALDIVAIVRLRKLPV